MQSLVSQSTIDADAAYEAWKQARIDETTDPVIKEILVNFFKQITVDSQGAWDYIYSRIKSTKFNIGGFGDLKTAMNNAIVQASIDYANMYRSILSQFAVDMFVKNRVNNSGGGLISTTGMITSNPAVQPTGAQYQQAIVKQPDLYTYDSYGRLIDSRGIPVGAYDPGTEQALRDSSGNLISPTLTAPNQNQVQGASIGYTKYIIYIGVAGLAYYLWEQMTKK